MPLLELAQMAGVALYLDVSADLTTVLGVQMMGVAVRPFQVILLDADGVTPVRTFSVTQGAGDTTVSLSPVQRRQCVLSSVLNTRGETVTMMTRPFYLVKG